METVCNTVATHTPATMGKILRRSMVCQVKPFIWYLMWLELPSIQEIVWQGLGDPDQSVSWGIHELVSRLLWHWKLIICFVENQHCADVCAAIFPKVKWNWYVEHWGWFWIQGILRDLWQVQAQLVGCRNLCHIIVENLGANLVWSKCAQAPIYTDCQRNVQLWCVSIRLGVGKPNHVQFWTLIYLKVLGRSDFLWLCHGFDGKKVQPRGKCQDQSSFWQCQAHVLVVFWP